MPFHLNWVTSADLSAHEGVDDGVVGSAGFGEERGNDGKSGGDETLPAKSLQHGDHSVGRPAHQETGNHH